MQVMLMCCIEERRWHALPEAERDTVMRDYGAWIAEQQRAGRHRASEKLARKRSELGPSWAPA